jgi:hypothetical protein
MPSNVFKRRAMFDWHGCWPALISLLLPAIFSLVVLDMTVRFLLPPVDHWPTFSELLQLGFDEKVADIQGRVSFTLASSYIRVAAIGAVILAYAVVRRRLGAKIAISAIVSAILVGAAIGKYVADNDVLLVNVVNGVLIAAQNSKVVAPDTVDRTHTTITINMVVGLAGVISLLVAFAAIAIRAQPHESRASRLRSRLADLQVITLCGALILVLLVVVSKTLLAWPQGLMTDAGKRSFGQLATTAVNCWGASGTAILLCTLLPAFFSLKADLDLAASRNNGSDPKRKREWVETNQLDFAPVSLIGTAIVTAAPMLTGPAIQIAGSLVR